MTKEEKMLPVVINELFIYLRNPKIIAIRLNIKQLGYVLDIRIGFKT